MTAWCRQGIAVGLEKGSRIAANFRVDVEFETQYTGNQLCSVHIDKQLYTTFLRTNFARLVSLHTTVSRLRYNHPWNYICLYFPHYVKLSNLMSS